jgi:hypothetical protein
LKPDKRRLAHRQITFETFPLPPDNRHAQY